ncbi:hypothetical protein, partial [Kocuria sp. APC 4018]|uniref:hypothetical protein n=1 Tax=Kocuria sp. APC 4018 TaxID=3035196 RepID=UPI0025B4E1D2
MPERELLLEIAYIGCVPENRWFVPVNVRRGDLLGDHLEKGGTAAHLGDSWGCQAARLTAGFMMVS